jgi:hypothetical protein
VHSQEAEVDWLGLNAVSERRTVMYTYAADFRGSWDANLAVICLGATKLAHLASREAKMERGRKKEKISK